MQIAKEEVRRRVANVLSMQAPRIMLRIQAPNVVEQQ